MPKPINQIKTEQDLGNRYLYAYRYFPLLLNAIEKEIGEDKMWEWLSNIFKSEIVMTNYDFILRTLEQTISANQIKTIKKKLLESLDSIENTKEHLGVN